MLTGTRVLAVIAWAAALVAALGVALIDPYLMATAGIVCAVAATGWGLLAMLRAGRMVREDDERRRREAVWARRDVEPWWVLGDDSPVVSETTYHRPNAHTVIEGGKRAVWPHEAGGIE